MQQTFLELIFPFFVFSSACWTVRQVYSDVESFKAYFLDLEHELEAVARDQEAGQSVVAEWPFDIWYEDIIMNIFEHLRAKDFGNFLICIGLCNDHKVLVNEALLIFFKFLLGKLVFQGI